MLGQFTEILWQLERKRKYYRWLSCGTNRVHVVTVAKALTLLVVLCLLYISVYSALDLGSFGRRQSVKMNLWSQPGSHPQEGNKEEDEELPSIGDLYYGQLRNSIWNGANNKNRNGKDANPKSTASIATRIINSLARNFHKADKDENGLLDEKELTGYVKQAIETHLDKAMKDNFDHYFRIDTNPRNGIVTWEEYLGFFFANKFIKGVTADDVSNRTPRFVALSKDIKVEIARIQASWSEAASNNPEFLTVDEFLAFEHPEASPTKIIANVDEIFATFDLDGDDTITQEELATTYKNAEGVDPIFKRDKHAIDSDGNGQISRIELMRYLDPRSMHHSESDAKELIKAADKDNDGRLSMLEVMRSANKVVKSKFYDIGNSLHNH